MSLECLVLEVTSFDIPHDLSASFQGFTHSVVHPTCTSKGVGGFRPASVVLLVLSDFACDTVHNSKKFFKMLEEEGGGEGGR